MYLLGQRRALLLVRSSVLSMLTSLWWSTPVIAQAIVSAAPPLLYQVETIYVAPTSEDLAPLPKARPENWTAVRITSTPDEAGAILSCDPQNHFFGAARLADDIIEQFKKDWRQSARRY